MKYTYWVSVNDQIVGSGLTYYKACKMFHGLIHENADSTLCVEIGNEQNGHCLNSVSLI